MSVLNMAVAPCDHVGGDIFAFEYTEALSGAGDTDVILVPESVKNVSIIAKGAAGATATIYYSCDLVSIVKSGSGVTWAAWSSGAVTAATFANITAITAIKMTQTGAGTSYVGIRAQ